jgi:hypothetical protein
VKLPKTRVAAERAGSKEYFTGEPCKRGHIAARSTSKSDCVECVRLRDAQRRAEKGDELRAYRRAWGEENKGYQAEWRRKNPDYDKHRRRKLQEEEAGRPRSSRCECCGKPERGKALAYDHCHSSGQFRGWLCSTCNKGLGLLGDTAASVRRALEYLERHEKKGKT